MRLLPLALLAACQPADPVTADPAPRVCVGVGTVRDGQDVVGTIREVIDEVQRLERTTRRFDGVDPTVVERRYDEGGRDLWMGYDHGADGSWDGATEWIRDADGNLVEQWYDDDGGGRDWGYRYTNDADGRVLESAAFTWGDDAPGELVRYVYDGDLLIAVDTDFGADGVVDTRSFYTYDRYGRLLDGRHYGPEGNVYSQVDNTWLAAPPVQDHVRVLTFANPDWADSETLLLHDDHGRLVHSESTWTSAEGAATSTEDYAYDALGNTVYARYERPETDLYPAAITTTRTTYDPGGVVLEELVDTDEGSDGTIDRVVRTTWSWDCEAG